MVQIKNMPFLGGKLVDKDVIIIKYLIIKGKNDIWLFLRLGTALKKTLNNVLYAVSRFIKLILEQSI